MTKLDGRTLEAQFINRVREELRGQIGNPTPVQELLIDRAALLSLRLAQIDRKILNDDDLTTIDSYSITDALVKCCQALGVTKTSMRPSLRSIMAVAD